MSHDTVSVTDVLLLALFIAGAMILGYLITRFKHARHARAWRPLLEVVQGEVRPWTGGGADCPMRGAYKGFAIVGTIIPEASSGEDSRYNHFMTGISGLKGAADWKLAYVHKLWPLGSAPAWRIESKDEALCARLDAADLAGIIEQLGILPDAPDPPVSFSVQRGVLCIQCDAGSDWVPSKEFFVKLLETLIVLARINAEVNAPVQ